MQILIFVGVLLFLIIIHELGHFFTALWCKVNVLEFGIGIPPKVKTLFTFKGIPFTLNALPFGGFVRMEGEGETEAGGTARAPGTVSLRELPLLKKLLVVLSGATVNFLFGILRLRLSSRLSVFRSKVRLSKSRVYLRTVLQRWLDCVRMTTSKRCKRIAEPYSLPIKINS
jgi:RIP metalloprotease RseP